MPHDNNPPNRSHGDDFYKMRVIINLLFYMKVIVRAHLRGSSTRVPNMVLRLSLLSI